MNLTYAALMDLADADLLPMGACPAHGWVPLDCVQLADCVRMQCPTCFHGFAQSQVTFMDDRGRRTHGVEVVTVETLPDRSNVVPWPGTRGTA